ncbi:MAG: hypothetical protein A4E63_00132 [Syntrophorhabdus sp. PtaU1.Bin050]|nr:MAG: hypothetical protein A4E63_00132 [Syntrophorhabdus sp. PtaU1.Bin050]
MPLYCFRSARIYRAGEMIKKLHLLDIKFNRHVGNVVQHLFAGARTDDNGPDVRLPEEPREGNSPRLCFS